MDASAERSQTGDDRRPPPERKGATRPRGESSGAIGAAPSRSSHDVRRKRPAEGRYVGWGDGLDRHFCARAARVLPTTFPVASHAGLATIATSIVARRPDALLLCSYSHCGAHLWPDGEVVDDAAEPHSNPAASEVRDAASAGETTGA